MSENYSYEKILPIAPLKIVALEGCRDLAKEVDKYLVDFREKGNQEFQDTPNFHGYHEETYLLKAPARVLEAVRQKVSFMNPSAVMIFSFSQTL